MNRTLVLSSVITFADTLAEASLKRGFPTTLAGDAARHLHKAPALSGATFHQVDLIDPYALPRTMCGCWDRFTHLFFVASPLLSNRLTNYLPEDLRHVFEKHVLGPIAAINAFHRLRLQSKPLADAPGAPYHLTVLIDSSAKDGEKEHAVRGATHAAIAAFVSRFAIDLAYELPGSKTTVFHLPMTGNIIDPTATANLVWDRVVQQEDPFRKYQVARNCGGSLRLDHM